MSPGASSAQFLEETYVERPGTPHIGFLKHSQCGQERTKLGPMSTDLGPSSASSDQNLPGIGQKCPGIDNGPESIKLPN